MSSNKTADICLIIEGSYPYVTGGVSSWVQRLVKTFENDFTFSIVALTAGDKKEEDMKYTLPTNIISFKSFNIFDYQFMEAPVTYKVRCGKRKVLNNTMKELILKGFVSGKLTQEQKLLIKDILESGEGILKEFLTSHQGFKILTSIYETKHKDSGFLKYFYNWRNILLVLWRVFMLLKKLPDAKIYHSPSTGFAGFLTCLMSEIYDKPSIITEHGIYIQEREMELKTASWLDEHYLIQMWLDFFKNITYWQYQSVSSLITLYHENTLLQIEYGAPKDKVKVIPNGINIKRFIPSRKERLTSNPPKIGIVARIDPVKNIETFIEAIFLVKNDIKNIQSYIVGPIDDKEYYERCRQLVDMLELSENIIFTGQADVTKYYKEFDLLLLTSTKEAMPLSVMEAMASGIPIVATNVGACRELIEGLGDNFGRAGFVANIMDAEDIAEKSLKILKNRELANKMAKIGIKRIEELYPEDVWQKSYKKEYQKHLRDDR